jgi:arylsulfatase A-like enzyme
MDGWHSGRGGMPGGLDRRDFLKQLALLPASQIAGRFSLPTLGQEQSGAPHIVIIVFDALSAINMSLYGYPRATTPSIERFAAKSTVFHRHYAGGNFTSPGTASLLTGSYPWSHRCMHLYGTVIDPFLDQNIFSLLSDGRYTRLAYTHNDHAGMLLFQFQDDLERLIKTKELALFFEKQLTESLYYGDHNTALMGERELIRGLSNKIPASLFLSILHHVWKSYEKGNLNRRYEDLFPRGLPSTNASPLLFVLEDGIDWVQEQILGANRPIVGYFHFFPPHEPYNTRYDFVDIFKDGWQPLEKPQHRFSQGLSQAKLDERMRLYDEYIAYADAEFGRLVDFMERHGLLEDTYLILTSDHGEMFERGIVEHVTPTLFEPIVKIPLIIHRPGQGSREDVHVPTSCVDLLPTLAYTAGLPNPEWSEGEVLPTFGEGQGSSERSLFSVEAKQNHKVGPLTEATIAMVKGDYKLIGYFGYGEYDHRYELYDVANDPEEMEDLYSESSLLASGLKAEMLAKLHEVNASRI